MTAQIFDDCNSCHLLKIPLPEYKTEWLKRPSFVKLYKIKNEILFGTVKFEIDHNGEPNAIIDLKKISVEQEQNLLKAFSLKSVPFRIVFYRSNFNGLFLGEGIQGALEDDEQIDILASFERLLDGIRLNCKIFWPKPQKLFDCWLHLSKENMLCGSAMMSQRELNRPPAGGGGL